MTIWTKTTGGQALQKRANRLPGVFQREVQEVIAQTARRAMGRAQQVCPVESGRLRASLRIAFGANRLSALVLTNVLYAPFVEFGAGRRQAHPFLFQGWNEQRPRFEPDLRAAWHRAARAA